MRRGFRGGSAKAIAVTFLVERDGDRCWYCATRFGDGTKLRTIDHAVPLVRGGTNDLANLRLACWRCNHDKGNATEPEYSGSEVLAARRRLVEIRRSRVLGDFLPRGAYHHSRIRWFGEGSWACDECRLSSIQGRRSPKKIPCLSRGKWAQYPPMATADPAV